MKKIYLLILTTLLSLNILAQNRTAAKPDVIQKINGEEMKGRLTKITDTDVSFIYSGETLEYTIKKSDILKIIHSSGRVEVFGQPPLPAESRQKDQVAMSASPVDHHNKIAVLPFTYLIDNQPGADEVGYKAQEDAYSFLSKHSAGYTILDPRTTNAKLIQAGVTKDKMMGFTMKDIADILGVEYLVDGSVLQTKGYQTTAAGGSSNTKVKRDGDEKIKGVSTSNSSYSNAAQRFEVSVSLHIYMDNNASIYNQNHKAFFTNVDGSYSSPLEYLLKRSPLYRK
jgi:TolB-like protein